MITDTIDIPVSSLKIEGDPTKLFENLARAQLEFDPVVEDAVGQAGSRSFKYADYTALVKATRPALASRAIVVLQPLHYENGQAVTTTILAGHGARISCSFSFKADTDPQVFGKNHTYYRRYQLQAMLGLAGEDADDAKAQIAARETKGFTEKQPEPKPAPKAPVESKAATAAPSPKQPSAPTAAPSSNGSSTTTVSDDRPVNARIIDGMKQLGWKMDDLKAFYKKEINKEGFDKADNLPADVKEKLYSLMVKKLDVAKF